MNRYAESSAVLAWLLDESSASSVRHLLGEAEVIVESESNRKREKLERLWRYVSRPPIALMKAACTGCRIARACSGRRETTQFHPLR